jgi:L-seryl-tRNA(Ser) seleniumtransferase
MNEKNSELRNLPSVDLVLREMTDVIDDCGHVRVTEAVRQELTLLRESISSGNMEAGESLLDTIIKKASDRVKMSMQNSFIPVFNLSGTVLHTNLGRAVLPQSAIEAIARVAQSSSNLEYDLKLGKRGDRDSHVEHLICELSGAEAATVVNNNAAAVLLTLNSLANRKQVPVSRGELVEIGGSFRMPEIIISAGCQLVEVGTTNRTHLKDYVSAINENTALFLKVHTSNYRIEGFASEVDENELAQLAQDNNLPFVIDLGSGNLIDLKAYGLPDEPTVSQVLENGADIVTFSGDKLLGGPQCGIIAGKKELIQKIKQNPLKRTLRLDKMTLAALVEVLRLYQNPEQLQKNLPTLAKLTRPVDEIREQSERVAKKLAPIITLDYEVTLTDCMSQVGSGALPTETIPSYGLSIRGRDNSDKSLRQLDRAMHQLPVPVIGRIQNGSYLLDFRCLDNEADFIAQFDLLVDALS